MAPEGVVRPKRSLGELDVPAVVVDEDGNTPLSGDCALPGKVARKEKARSSIVLRNEDMMFSGRKAQGRIAAICARRVNSLYRNERGNSDARMRPRYPRLGR